MSRIIWCAIFIAAVIAVGHPSAQGVIGGTVSGLPSAPGAPARVQRPGLPPRDNTAVPTGTARLRGRVVSAETGQPLRRAQVMVFATDIQLRRIVTRDGEGRFGGVELPAGRYTINASKGGYVSLQYGQRRPFEPGTPVVLSDDQTL